MEVIAAALGLTRTRRRIEMPTGAAGSATGTGPEQVVATRIGHPAGTAGVALTGAMALGEEACPAAGAWFANESGRGLILRGTVGGKGKGGLVTAGRFPLSLSSPLLL